MASVTINPPKTPVTKGSNGVAAATLPNVCKMPGPPAPFVPIPLPNIGRSGISPKNYSRKVKIEGQPVAICGSSFGSQGDIASKGTGGGIASNNTQGPTQFVAPGSLKVKIEGKSVQLLGDQMLNNAGPSGAPSNSATMQGVLQENLLVAAVERGQCSICKNIHEGIQETEQTKADAGTLASNFQKEVAAIAGRVQTMLGVVRCQCSKNYAYADQSAATTIELCNAAKATGMKFPEGSAVSVGSPKTAGDVAYLETLDKMKKRIGEHLGNSENFNKAWEEGEKRSRHSDKHRSGPASYPPGTCAAQKTLMLLVDDGALPSAMTERWHSSTGKKTQAPIEYIDNRRSTREKKVEKFDHGATTPPCGTCVLLIPLLLCPGDKKECAHKS